MRRLAAVIAAVAAGCSGGNPTSFGINVTVEASGIAAPDLARITTAVLSVSGVEDYQKSFDISTPIKTGEVRFRYIPKQQSGQLTLALEVTDAAGEVIAGGVSDAVTIAAGRAVAARIVLGVPPADMSVDDSGEDGGFDASMPIDLAMPPLDMTPIAFNCMGMAKCVYDCLNGGSDLNTCQVQCSKSAKPGSASKWTTAVVCGQDYCVGDTDMMTGRCVEVPIPGGGSLLCDPSTTYAQCSAQSYVSTSCGPCLDQARSIWIFDVSKNPPGPPTGMCSMPTSADCMGAHAQCVTQFNACLNDP